MRFASLLCLALLLASLAPAVDVSSVQKGLQLWVRADDLPGMYKDGDRIDVWPDAGGQARHLKASGDARPALKADGINGLPTVLFTGDLRAKTKILQYFDLPLTGEWGGITVFAVGKRLAGPGWLDTAPGGNGCLRTMGWLQLCGTKIAADHPFNALGGKPDDPALAAMTIGAGEQGGLVFASYVNGRQQATAKDDDPLYGIISTTPTSAPTTPASQPLTASWPSY